MATDIHIDDTGKCRVTQGTSRRTYQSTPLSIAMAIMSQVSPEDADEGQHREGQWIDMLATHGVAIGRVRRRDITLAIVPSKQRSFAYNEDGERSEGTALFPPLLIGLATTQRRYVQGAIALCNVTKQAQMTVVAVVPCLATFPYGNVYTGTGRICWGQVQHSTVSTIQELETLFFNSGFNLDLYHMSDRGNIKTLATAARTNMLPVPAMNWTIPDMIEQLVR